MNKIRIKNFGPIKEGFTDGDGYMDIGKITVLTGNQGSGKSTVAKLYSAFCWMEKDWYRRGKHRKEGAQIQELLKWSGILKYGTVNSEIAFSGDALQVVVRQNSDLVINHNLGQYVVPKIMYVPAERMLLTTIKEANGITNLPPSLRTLGEEYKAAQIALKDARFELPIGNVKYKYDEATQESFIVFQDGDGKERELNLLHASSGFQSLAPLSLVSRNLALAVSNGGERNRSIDQTYYRNEEIAKIMLDDTIAETEKLQLVNGVKERYKNGCFINIVEEPELNLYPESQRAVLNSLVEFAYMNKHNQLVITTHSPYIINYLALAVEVYKLKQKAKTEELLHRLNEIVPLGAAVNPSDLKIYELNEKDGSITLLRNYEDLPSDKNLLNDSLGQSNELFSQLLDIEELCR